MKVLLLLFLFRISCCDWVSEWLVPIQEIKDAPVKKSDEMYLKMYEDETLRMTPIYGDPNMQVVGLKNKDMYEVISEEPSPTSLKEKLEITIGNAKALAATLKSQIMSVASREQILKEAIVNGGSGVTVLTITSIGRLPRNYIIRDGFWTLCNGLVQYPATNPLSANIFNELFASPRCIGQEVVSRRDPCVYNSIIKYETIPVRRGIVYSEDDYLCLKPNFNQTLERYLSVPKNIVNETCKSGIIKRIADNRRDCGLRVMSEYTYYPHKTSSSTNLPLEYCTEKDGSCKLIVAWHICNSTIENFEYLKNDKAFKNFFLNTGFHGS